MSAMAFVLAVALIPVSVFDQAAGLQTPLNRETSIETLEEMAKLPWPLLPKEGEEELAARVEELSSEGRHRWALDRALPVASGELQLDGRALAVLLAILEEERSDDAGTLSLLAKAREHYERREFGEASSAYAHVERPSSLWPAALRERGWTFYRLGQPADALGVSISLAAPWFPTTEHAEARLLEATILLEKCRWAEARARVEPYVDPSFMLDANDAGAVLLASEPPKVWVRVIDAPLVGRVRSLVLGATPKTEEGRKVLDDVIREGERLLRAEVERERAHREALARRSLAVVYESLRGERIARERALIELEPVPGALPALGDDEVAWEFHGTWWRDELGSYRYIATDVCPPKEGR